MSEATSGPDGADGAARVPEPPLPGSLANSLLITGGMWLLVIVVGTVAIVQLGYQVASIRCERDAAGVGDCVITQRRGFAHPSRHLDAADLQGASVAVEWAGTQKNPRVGGAIDLATRKGPLRLSVGPASGDTLPWRYAVAKQIDDFAKARGPGRLDVRDEPPTYEANLWLAWLIFAVSTASVYGLSAFWRIFVARRPRRDLKR